MDFNFDIGFSGSGCDGSFGRAGRGPIHARPIRSLRFRLGGAAGITAKPLRPSAAANNFERLAADIARRCLRNRQRELREFIRSIEALDRSRRSSVACKTLI
ncbi:hypothetical protein AB7M69_000855 [Bradyrhizobium japonicum]